MGKVLSHILTAFGLSESTPVSRIGSGHINHTYKVEGEPAFILQRINTSVFRQPATIAGNIDCAARFLRLNHPQFFFMAGIAAQNGAAMVYDHEGFPWRMFPFIEHTKTVDQLETEDQAYSAAREFGRLTRFLDGCDVSQFKPTIDRFHDLSWRYQQLETALSGAQSERLTEANESIQMAQNFSFLVQQYEKLIRSGGLVQRITHNDTKINNILFDSVTGQAVCAIDLDTLMPGYFIYDLGDMVRTFVSPVSEEEKDRARIVFRKSFYEALLKGYLSQMNDVMSEAEKNSIPFAGWMMTYIMAIRFLADYLNGDVYYHTTYPGQNLVRAKNQLRLLEILHKNLS